MTSSLGSTAIRVAGALSGAVFVPSLSETVQILRLEISRLLGVEDCSSIKLILGGKTLQDSQLLSALNLGPTSRVLVTRGQAASHPVNAETEKLETLERLCRVVENLSGGNEKEGRYQLSLENQAGSQVRFKPEDQRALIMGLTMHQRGKKSMLKGDFITAQEELLLAEEAFGICDPGLIANIDNVGMVMLDIVWCAYKLQDSRRLAVCRDRLTRARQAFTQAYGPNLERARKLNGAFQPEQATFVRLGALEGVVSYYAGDLEAASAGLSAAKEKLLKLKVSDHYLLMLQDMGYEVKESTRALRFSGNDIDAAVHFISQQRGLEKERKAKRLRQQEWSQERAKYGRTTSGAFVDVEPLDIICNMGYEKSIVAEALRQTDNDASAALETVLDPSKRAAIALQLALTASNAQPDQAAEAASNDSRTQQLAKALARSMAEAMQGVETPTPSGAASSCQSTHVAVAQNVHPPDGAEKSADPCEVQEAEPFQSEKDTELENEIVASVQGGADPLDAYDMNLTEEEDVINTFLALLLSQSG
ncbi:hypothetical protein CEUSTIGMA_g8924.t1 [Chlamydomonas eustigma]|uniref:UBA domain-containing protein n=1 Tax=Chlamydomonas eustigma TaxID=1157962 RepID=A0A250XEJ0_9CHLO|nr:hypothetical protein CEUSTIGMA_g8924.t1 [Chlamydomonas eustigma]|eukprot:GAX81495.1 hypothetical protein CEUSTIGMA_g8924.t1 [Chlamydomonas eustigma]